MDTIEILEKGAGCDRLVQLIKWKNHTPEQLLAKFYPTCRLVPERSGPLPKSIDLRAEYLPSFRVVKPGNDYTDFEAYLIVIP